MPQDGGDLVHAAEHEEDFDFLRCRGFGRPAAEEALEARCVAWWSEFALEGLQEEAVAVVEIEEEQRVVGVHDLHLVIPEGGAGADGECLGVFAVGDAAGEERAAVRLEEVV